MRRTDTVLQEVALATQNETVPILLACDFPIFRDTLKTHFEQVSGIKVVGCAASEAEVLSLLESLDPKLVMLDLNVEWDALCSLLEHIRTSTSARSLIMSDILDSKHVIQALRHGAHGVVPRRTTPELLTKSVYTVLEGGFWISRAMVADFVNIIRESGASAAKRAKPSDIEGEAEKGMASTVPASSSGASQGDISQLGLASEELRVMSALVAGKTHKEIASAFGISEDAVKHQVTSIYRKLGVYSNLDLVLFGWIDQQLA
jgi:DNA-binding NarL/FixJ family response regulator